MNVIHELGLECINQLNLHVRIFRKLAIEKPLNPCNSIVKLVTLQYNIFFINQSEAGKRFLRQRGPFLSLPRKTQNHEKRPVHSARSEYAEHY